MKLKIEDNEIQFIESIEHDFTKKIKHNKLSVEKQAAKFSISNKNEIKELAELAIVRIARSLITSNVYQSFQNLVKLYEWQANLSHRTSQSMLLQQYSTPVPISYLASQYVKSNEIETYYFEPSAGNGLLTIALPYESVYVNELDDVRLSNLKTQPFLKISSQDATLPFPDYYHCFDGIITNPPFGTLLDAVDYDSFPIKTLDHLMALRALDCMKDNGKAAIIIGGHTDWDEKGRIQLGKNRIFFNYLYSHYNVEDVILIDGHKLYSRQGTAFDVRLILINGRKKIFEGVAPLKNASLAKVVNSFDELWERISIENITVNADSKKNESFTTSNNDNKIDNYLAAENNKQQNLTHSKGFVFKNMGSYKFWIEETKGKPLLSYTEDEIISFLRTLNLNQLVGVGSKETRVNKIAQMLIWNFAKKEDDSNLTLEQYAIAHFIEEAKTEAFMFSEALLVPIEDYRSAWEKKKKIVVEKTNEVIKENTANTKQRFSNVIELYRKQIVVNPETFQGRKHKFSQETVNKILSEGFDKSNDPIVVWYDEEIEKYVVISGHSRWEASEILYHQGDKSLEKMPVKVFMGDKSEAQSYAIIESNRASTNEGFLSDLKAVKKMLIEAYAKTEMLKYVKPKSYLEKLINYSYLNEKGKFIEYLDSESKISFPYLERNAEWVGMIRKQNQDKITNLHETEIFNYLYQNDKKSLAISKDDFFKLIESKVYKLDFNPDKPLNLHNVVSTSALTDDLSKEIKESQKEIERLNKEIDRKQDLIIVAKQDASKLKLVEKFEKDIHNLNLQIVMIKENIARKERDIKKIENQTTFDLFSQQQDEEPSHASTKNKLKLKMKLKAKALELMSFQGLGENEILDEYSTIFQRYSKNNSVYYYQTIETVKYNNRKFTNKIIWQGKTDKANWQRSHNIWNEQPERQVYKTRDLICIKN